MNYSLLINNSRVKAKKNPSYSEGVFVNEGVFIIAVEFSQKPYHDMINLK